MDDYIKRAKDMLDHFQNVRTQDDLIKVAQVYALIAIAEELRELITMLGSPSGQAHVYVSST